MARDPRKIPDLSKLQVAAYCHSFLVELDASRNNLTDWESEFLGSCLKRQSFTEKQLACIFEMMGKYPKVNPKFKAYSTKEQALDYFFGTQIERKELLRTRARELYKADGGRSAAPAKLVLSKMRQELDAAVVMPEEDYLLFVMSAIKDLYDADCKARASLPKTVKPSIDPLPYGSLEYNEELDKLEQQNEDWDDDEFWSKVTWI